MFHTLYVYKVEAYVKLLPSTYRKKVSLDLPLDDYMYVIIWSTFDFDSTASVLHYAYMYNI